MTKAADISEEVFSLDRQGTAVGILTRPSLTTQDSETQTPCVLFFNAGLEHRVGPNRLYVELARYLARLGFPALRFDSSGVGDSLYTGDDINDIAGRVVDKLSERGVADQVIVCGICSGADDAHRFSVADSRVSAVILLDGYCAKTRRYHLAYWLPRLLSPRRWLNFVRRSSTTESEPEELRFDYREMPGRQEAADGLRQLLARDTRLLYVFSGEVQGYYSYGAQFHDAFSDVEGVERVDVIYFPGAGHTYPHLADRRQLFLDIRKWLAA